MKCRLDSVLLREWHHARSHPDASLVGAESLHAERLHLLEDGLDFGIAEVVADGHDVGKEIEPGGVELPANLAEPVQRLRQPPLAQRFTRLQVFGSRRGRRLAADRAAGDARFEQRVDELHVADPTFERAGNHHVDDVLPRRGGERAVDTGDGANLHPSHGGRRGR